MKKGSAVLIFGLFLIMIFLSLSFVSAAWTATDGGNHDGLDWIITLNTEVAGSHYNIGKFVVSPGVILIVKPFDGINYGSFVVNATNILINGTIDASGAGYGGGGGGGGGAGGTGGGEGQGMGAAGGIGGAGIAGGLNGVNGGITTSSSSDTSGKAGGAGGKGGGSFGGTGGTGGAATAQVSLPIGAYGKNGANGAYGKYCNGISGVCDSSIDETLFFGSAGGGGGGAGGAPWNHPGSAIGKGPGGGGGGAGAGGGGGGIIKLYSNVLNIPGNLLARGLAGSGNGGNGGNGAYINSKFYAGKGGNAGAAVAVGLGTGGNGGIGYATAADGGKGGTAGAGAGGGVLIKADIISITGTIDNRGGGDGVVNGGTLKILCGAGSSMKGSLFYGRLYNTSACSIALPICGNGKNETGESCDDGNINLTDGCNNCVISSGWNCVVNASGTTICILSCADECNLTDWKLVCSGNNVSKEICGNYDTDSCLEYGNSTLNKTCSADEFCSIGLCTTIPIIAPESCFSYDSQSKCGNFNVSVAKKDADNYILSSFSVKSMPIGGFCGTNNVVKSVALFNGICNYSVNNCACSWNINGEASCGKSFELKRTCFNSTGTKEAVGQCDISTSVENTCGSPGGKLLQKSTAVWKVLSGDETYKPEKGVCESKTAEYPCPSTQKLPFFTLWNFVISLSLIAVIYFVLHRKQ